MSLTLALATIIVFASMRRRAAEDYLDDRPPAAVARARARAPPPPVLEGVVVQQPRGRLVAGVPCEGRS